MNFDQYSPVHILVPQPLSATGLRRGLLPQSFKCFSSPQPPVSTEQVYVLPRNNGDVLNSTGPLGLNGNGQIIESLTPYGDLSVYCNSQLSITTSPSFEEGPSKYPIQDLFSVLDVADYLKSSRVELLERAETNAALWKTFTNLEKRLEELDYTKEESGESYLVLVKALIEGQQAKLTLEQYLWLHNKFKDLGFFKGIIALNSVADDEKYKSSLSVQADLLLALNRLGYSKQAIEFYEQMALGALERVSQNEPGAAEIIHEILISPGTSYKEMGFAADKLAEQLSLPLGEVNRKELQNLVAYYNENFLGEQINPANIEALIGNIDTIRVLKKIAQEAHQKSHDYYKSAYRANFSDYAGICYVRSLAVNGKVQEAIDLADHVYQTTYKADYQKSFWPCAIRLETSILTGDTKNVYKLLPKVINMGKGEESEYQSLIRHLKGCYKGLEGKQKGLLSLVIEKLESKDLSNLHPSQVDPITEAIENRWLRLDYASSDGHYVANRGIVPNINNNYLDRCIARQTLIYKPENERAIIEMDFYEARKRIAELVTMWFELDKDGVRVDEQQEETRWLELLNTPDHEVKVDKPCNKYFDFFGARETGLNSTNVMLLPFLGLGDCRNAHFVYQKLLGGYLNLRKQYLIEQSFNAKESSQTQNYQEIMTELKELNKIEVFICQIVINSNIKANKIYDIPRTDGGEFIHSESPNDLEEHTLACVFMRDDEENFTDCMIVNPEADLPLEAAGHTSDIWYNEEYPFGNFPITRRNVLLQDGTLTFVLPKAGKALNESTGHLEEVDVNLRFAPYAGPRQKTSRTTGSLALRVAGQLVNPPRDVSILFNRDQLRAFQTGFRDALLSSAA